MNKHIFTVVIVLLIIAIKLGDGLRCLECAAKSNEDTCETKATNRECSENEACLTLEIPPVTYDNLAIPAIKLKRCSPKEVCSSGRFPSDSICIMCMTDFCNSERYASSGHYAIPSLSTMAILYVFKYIVQ